MGVCSTEEFLLRTTETRPYIPTYRFNTKLDAHNIKPIQNLEADISDGVRLIQLLVGVASLRVPMMLDGREALAEIIGDTTLGKYTKNPKMRIQKLENVSKALDFIKHRGVPLTNIGAEDIVDNNLKLILGMIWTIILRFTIADISQEGLTAKEGLLLWCQRKTAPYPEVNVRDFTYSWTDGLAFCALIHRHRPDLLDFDSLDKTDRHGNTALAFEVAERHLGITKLLDVEDVCDISKPDERSVMTYVAEYFHAFSALDKVETAGRRVAKFAEVMNSVWEMQHDYERRVLGVSDYLYFYLGCGLEIMRFCHGLSCDCGTYSLTSSLSRFHQLMESVENQKSVWERSRFDGSYTDAKRQASEFFSYKNTDKRAWIAEKRDVDTLLGNIQTKLKTYNLAPYTAPLGLTLTVGFRAGGAIKENLRKSFATAANDFQRQLNTISTELASLQGDLDYQLSRVNSLTSKLQPLKSSLGKIEDLDRQCTTAHVEENDYTIYTVDDLSFDLKLVQQAVQKKFGFIENQVWRVIIVSRNMTNLTPGQLEEFESTFRYFDKDQSNTMSAPEFSAALASLGMSYDDDEFKTLFRQITQNNDEATFEQVRDVALEGPLWQHFITFMVSVTEDKTTPDQLRQSFKTVASDKAWVTELDLKMCLVPVPIISYLKQSMPKSQHSPDGYNYSAYVDQVFMK
ncbi:hypothetical protein BC936DRAFT_139078 [Jimgerdemannia flammicorona]|uniref:Calponin homology domain-containing protein n=1 Tax=Jimgerdemannia flammicorona TaxID=994334 RepID=A0A433BAQ3_9FUNG|nr:hypothetical protein BC936DRAFT_139078 [Jimgerdemannia flammicorona]